MRKSQLAVAVAAAMSTTVGAVDEAATLISVVSESSMGPSVTIVSASTATWTYNTSTGIVTASGNYKAQSQIAPTSPGSLFFHDITNLAIGGGGAASATSYTCTDGLLAPIYGAGYCGNHNYGANATLESTVSYGPGTAFSKTIGGDDADLGAQQNLTGYDGHVASNAGPTLTVTNAVPGTGGQTFTFNVPGLAPTPAAPTVAVVDDTNSNSINEAVLQRGGSVKLESRDGSSGANLLQKTILSAGTAPVGITGVPDSNSNGAGEIASLTTDGATLRLRVTDGATKLALSNGIVSVAGHTGVDLASIGDINTNGAAEVAVLITRDSDGAIFVRPTDAATGLNAAGANIPFFTEGGFTPIGLAVIPDSNTSGADELAVLATRDSDSSIAVEIRESDATGGGTRRFFLDNGFTPIDVEIGADADGDSAPDVAVLARRNSDGRIVVERRNASGAAGTTRLWFFTDGNWPGTVDLVAIGDQNGDTVPEYAVLALRNDGNPAVETRNAVTGNNAPTREFYLGTGFLPSQLVDLGDTDSNGITNLGVLGSRISDSRIKLEVRNPRGNPNTTHIWYSP